MKKLSAALMLAAMSLSAHALEVRPLITTFPAAHKAGTMTVSNTDEVEKTYQVFLDELTLVDGKQVRTKSTDIRFAPSIMTIKPKQSQTVRYVRSGPAVSNEAVYRVRVEEIPAIIKPEKSGVVYSMRMDFPWIWRAASASPSLTASWTGRDLTVRNTGTATAQLVNLKAGSKVKQGLIGYLLPGETATYKMDATPVQSVSVMVNSKPVELDVK